jgi:hypothetical protein
MFLMARHIQIARIYYQLHEMLHAFTSFRCIMRRFFKKTEGGVMSNYYINMNAQNNGDHEVHKEGCSYIPSPQNRKFLGSFTSCKEAVKQAKIFDSKADGCFYCCHECHTR